MLSIKNDKIKKGCNCIQEIYKDIIYRNTEITVSNFGTVIWNNSVRNRYYNADGYAVCAIKINDVGWRSVFVHVLVALAFIPNPDNLPEVNHKDFNRANPRVDNLEWITRKDNVRYSLSNRIDYHGENNPNYGNHKLSEKYKNNKLLSKEKNSRPGLQNGRCRKIELYYDNTYVCTFDYISLCCQYFIDNKIAFTNNPESIRSQINKCINKGTKYKTHYSFIKK